MEHYASYYNNLSPVKLATELIDWFENKNVKPYALLRKLALKLSILKWPDSEKLKLKQIIRTYVKNYTSLNLVTVKKAPQIKWESIFDLAKKLFMINSPKYKGSDFRRKAAATALYLSTFGAQRWADIMKIYWQDITVTNREHGKFLLIRVRGTKANWKGDSNDAIVLPLLGKKYRWRCPVLALMRFWDFCGRPTAGLVFSNDGRKPSGQIYTD